MNPAAVAKATLRLEKAKLFLASDKFPNYTAAVTAWTDFLLAFNGVFSLLEQGAKENPRSAYWFGTKKKQRREDPLLRYLHHARNADEHGLAPVTKHQLPTVTEADGGNGGTIEKVQITEDKIVIVYDDSKGRVPLLSIGTPFVSLITVTSQYGDSFDPPESHLGQPLPNNHPYTVARAGIAYLVSLIDEASSLIAK